jgi:hypothetical protein
MQKFSKPHAREYVCSESRLATFSAHHTLNETIRIGLGSIYFSVLACVLEALMPTQV